MPNKPCTVQKCDTEAVTRGWCAKHYMRWRKYGDPNMTVRGYDAQPKVCSCEDCDDEAVSRGFCAKHYTRFRKHGDPNIVKTRGNLPSDPKDRFKAKYLVDEDTGCWVWTGAANGNGWATISIDGKAVMAHRFAYETFVGPIPEGDSIRRTCSNSRCVNPEHLVLLPGNPEKRFWANVDKQGVDECWTWKPVSFVFRVQGEPCNPRQFAYRLLRGVTEEALYALCGNAKCVNPEHAGTAQDRFWGKVEKRKDGCWYWTGSTLVTGYPHLTFDGKSVYAHRLTYEWSGRVLEEGFVLAHIEECGHKSCVNPDHLEQISYQEMVDRREFNKDLASMA